MGSQWSLCRCPWSENLGVVNWSCGVCFFCLSCFFGWDFLKNKWSGCQAFSRSYFLGFGKVYPFEWALAMFQKSWGLGRHVNVAYVGSGRIYMVTWYEFTHITCVYIVLKILLTVLPMFSGWQRCKSIWEEDIWIDSWMWNVLTICLNWFQSLNDLVNTCVHPSSTVIVPDPMVIIDVVALFFCFAFCCVLDSPHYHHPHLLYVEISGLEHNGTR